MDKSTWLSIGEAAKYLGISKDTLRRWEKKGKIKSVRSPSNHRYYTQNQLNQIMSDKRPEIIKPKPANNRINIVLVGLLSFAAAIILGLLAVLLLAL